MEYPKINLTLQKVRQKADTEFANFDIPELGFTIDRYYPGEGGTGHYRGQEKASVNFASLDSLSDMLVQQADVPAEEFYYQDAFATREEVTQDFASRGVLGSWEDTLVYGPDREYPIRVMLFTYFLQGDPNPHGVAVMRDGTTVDDFTKGEH
jgi:hypothetical protein